MPLITPGVIEDTFLPLTMEHSDVDSKSTVRFVPHATRFNTFDSVNLSV